MINWAAQIKLNDERLEALEAFTVNELMGLICNLFNFHIAEGEDKTERIMKMVQTEGEYTKGVKEFITGGHHS